MLLPRYKIIYEDNWLIVVNKPSGMLVIPTPKKEKNTLTGLLGAHPCHRIDKETSGLILYAKGKKVQRIMMEQFKNRLVKKRYVAFVHGIVKKNSGELKDYIYNRNKRRQELAITKYNVIERRKDFSILEVEPVTGRTNQIRIQFKRAGHTLVGESVYAFRKDFKLKFKRLALHAESLEFAHPIAKEKLSFTAPLPQDMENFLITP